MPDRITKAVINLDHYRHNLRSIRRIIGDKVAILAVVKANAYGHGIEEIAHAATNEGVEYLGVVSIGELRRIRAARVFTPCLIINFLDVDSIDEALELEASFTAMDEDFILSLQAAAKAQNKVAKVHVKIDTGMHRAGCDPAVVVNLATIVEGSPNLDLEGVFTHFAESEAPDLSYTDKQLDIFKECLKKVRAAGMDPKFIHTANSAAIFSKPEAQFTMVRPGLVTYGLNPFDPENAMFKVVEQQVKPILQLVSRVAYLRSLKSGDPVGYNRRWVAKRDSTVALVPVGYGDGYRRTPQNSGYMLVNGCQAPILGTVAMDQTVIDVTDIPEVKVGSEVVILGSQKNESISASDIAQRQNTINYEVVTALSDRIVREYTSGTT